MHLLQRFPLLRKNGAHHLVERLCIGIGGLLHLVAFAGYPFLMCMICSGIATAWGGVLAFCDVLSLAVLELLSTKIISVEQRRGGSLNHVYYRFLFSIVTMLVHIKV